MSSTSIPTRPLVTTSVHDRPNDTEGKPDHECYDLNFRNYFVGNKDRAGNPLPSGHPFFQPEKGSEVTENGSPFWTCVNLESGWVGETGQMHLSRGGNGELTTLTTFLNCSGNSMGLHTSYAAIEMAKVASTLNPGFTPTPYQKAFEMFAVTLAGAAADGHVMRPGGHQFALKDDAGNVIGGSSEGLVILPDLPSDEEVLNALHLLREARERSNRNAREWIAVAKNNH